MVVNNKLVAVFDKIPSVTTHYVYQYDYGAVLYVTGIKNLPGSLEVQFTKDPRRGKAIIRVGTTSDDVLSVDIPNALLENNGITRDYYVYALFYVEDPSAKTGKTLYTVRIPVNTRQNPHTDKPTDEGAFATAVKNISELATKTDAAKSEAEAWAHGGVEAYPQCDEDNAKHWSEVAKTYNDEAKKNADRSEKAADRSDNSASSAAESVKTMDYNVGLARDAASDATSAASAANSAKKAAADSAEASAKSEANASRYADQAKESADNTKKYVDDHYREFDINTDDNGINAVSKDINGNVVTTKQILGYDWLREKIEALNHPVEILEFNTHYEFPNIGEHNKFYLDKSTGDMFVFGVNGNVYTSVGVANDDIVFGGGA